MDANQPTVNPPATSVTQPVAVFPPPAAVDTLSPQVSTAPTSNAAVAPPHANQPTPLRRTYAFEVPNAPNVSVRLPVGHTMTAGLPRPLQTVHLSQAATSSSSSQHLPRKRKFNRGEPSCGAQASSSKRSRKDHSDHDDNLKGQ
ncbi:hypothetical protein VKT23_013032 [Stygiomarasmius scandens]|uniref:Uncharacterized protein n=1 Tax=Marasmiellus scandens TaxID=2682957 RepID=A0ABR1J974_9AGAR